MLLQIDQRRLEPDACVVSLSGKLALGRESQKVEGIIDELIRNGERKLIFDLTALHYIDSAGVGALAYCAGKLREAGGRLVVVAAEGRVRQILKSTQVDSIVPVCGTMEAASLLFAQPPAAV